MTGTISITIRPSQDRLDAHYGAGFWRDETIYRLARDRAEGAPDAWAIRDRGRRLTYRELIEASDRFAADLHRRGVEPGQPVAVWLPGRVEAAVVLLACSRNGYVCAPSLHRDHTVADILELLRRMSAAALVMQPGYGADADRRDIEPALAELASLKHVYRLGGVDAPPFGGLPDTETGEPAPADDSDSVVYLPFTSGTTDAPKGVLHTDNTLLANARTIASDWNFGPASRIYTMSPLSHNLGFGALVSALAVGAELVIHDLAPGASLLDRLGETGATFLFGVPTHAIDLLAELRAGDHGALPDLEGFRISGAAVPAAVVEELIEFGITPQSGYGMTEACSHHYTMPGDPSELIAETSGRACAGYEVRIWAQEDQNAQAPAGEVGEIGGRGASLMLGYFDDEKATEDAFNAQGWFMTGDLGRVDEAGYLTITGRRKDMIVRGGHNIFPARIEALAMRHHAVERAAAVPISDPRLGEKVCLAVTLRPGRELEGEALLQHLDDAGLSKYDMPEYFLRLDQMPLTSNGKVLKRDLNAWIEEERVKPEPVRWQGPAADETKAG